MFENIETGDKVWDFVYGWGQVTEINPLDNFPFKVKFKSTFCTYTYSGSEFKGHAQTLFWDEIKFEMPERPKPRFEIGEWVVDEHCTKSLPVTDQNIKNINAGTSYTLWKPQEGEWCVFYNDNESYVVAKFERSVDGKHYCKERGWFGNITPLELIKKL